MFIQVDSTPNPDTLKFLLDFAVAELSGMEFTRETEHQDFTLIKQLFDIDGVEKIYCGGDFIAITKAPHVVWETLKPEVLVVMTDYFALRAPTSGDTSASSGDESEEQEFFDESDAEVVAQVKDLIENYVRPAVAQDGGDIKFRGYKEGVVFVKLRGACSGCPSATVTLKDGVYGMLSYYVPAVKAVESI